MARSVALLTFLGFTHFSLRKADFQPDGIALRGPGHTVRVIGQHGKNDAGSGIAHLGEEAEGFKSDTHFFFFPSFRFRFRIKTQEQYVILSARRQSLFFLFS